MSAFRAACAAFGLISFEDQLRRAAAKEVLEHTLRVTYCDDRRVAFSVRAPAGDPMHYAAEGNRLVPCDSNGTVR